MKNIQLNTQININDENVLAKVDEVLARVRHLTETLEPYGKKATVTFIANPMKDTSSINAKAESEDRQFEDMLNGQLDKITAGL